MHFIDLHSHVLWGLDDGARTAGDTAEMLRLLADLGFSCVYATPHQKLGAFEPSAEAIALRHAEVCHEIAAGLGLTIGLAAENFWDELFLGRAQRDQVPGYRLPAAPGGSPAPQRAAAGGVFLFELPVTQLPPRLEDQLFALRLRGRLPVLAHPERYEALWKNDARVRALSRSAALVIDLAAVDGAHGPERARAARHLLTEDLCHAAASDVHQPADVRAVAAGIAWIKKKLGPARLKRLLSDGPRQILEGDLPDLPG